MTTVARGSAIDVAARAMTERQLQDAVTGMAQHHGILTWHDNDSRRNRAGMPDLILVGTCVAYWELKTQRGRVRPEQHAFLTALVRAGASARIIRPMDLLSGEVERAIRAMSPRRAAS